MRCKLKTINCKEQYNFLKGKIRIEVKNLKISKSLEKEVKPRDRNIYSAREER